jgi:hypothetical protein
VGRGLRDAGALARQVGRRRRWKTADGLLAPIWRFTAPTESAALCESDIGDLDRSQSWSPSCLRSKEVGGL